MMMEPSMVKVLGQIPNRYMIVNVAAKRARQIAMAAEEQDEILDEKPVTLALREIAEGKIEVLDRPAPDEDYTRTAKSERKEKDEEPDERVLIDEVVNGILDVDEDDTEEEQE